MKTVEAEFCRRQGEGIEAMVGNADGFFEIARI